MYYTISEQGHRPPHFIFLLDQRKKKIFLSLTHSHGYVKTDMTLGTLSSTCKIFQRFRDRFEGGTFHWVLHMQNCNFVLEN